VTMVECGYTVADGPPSRRGPDSTPADFRNLTPLVVMDALEKAGTVVCEPVLRIGLEVPVWSASALLTALGRLGTAVRGQAVQGELTTIEADIAAARLRELQRQLPAITAGEGVLESTFDGYRPTIGDPPTRARATADPRNRKEYLLSLTREGARASSPTFGSG
jgi:ribosomal protection tetracycline resistance protein